MKYKVCGHVVVLVWACAAAARGADPSVPAGWPVAESKAYLSIVTQTIAPETERLVARLGSDEFAVREAAAKELAEKGAAAFPGLWEAAEKSGDAEAQARVRPYFYKGPFRVPPNAPADVVAAIDEYIKLKARWATMKEIEKRLLLSGSIDIRSDENKVYFLNMLREQETETGLIDDLMKDPWAVTIRARLAILAGQFDEAESILRTNVDLGPKRVGAADYAALAAMRRGAAFDPQKELDAANIKDEQAQNELGVWLFRAKGDLRKAAEFGRALPFEPSGRSIKLAMVEARQYGELAEDIQTDEKRERYFLTDAIAYQLAGEERKAQQVLEGPLKDAGVFRVNNRNNTLTALIRAGQVEAVIEAARQKEDEQWMAAALLCRQLRVEEALAAVKGQKHPPMELLDHLIDMGLASAARKMLVGIVPDEAALKDQAAVYESDLAALLDRVGEAAAADKWRTRACDLVDQARAAEAERNKKPNEVRQRMAAIEAIPTDRRTPEAKAQLDKMRSELRNLQDQISNDMRNGTIIQQSFSVRYEPRTKTGIEFQEAASWMDNGSFSMSAIGTVQERFRIMRGIFSGNYPGDELIKVIKLDPKSRVIDWQLKIATRSLQRVHREDLGRKLVEQDFGERKDPSTFAILGDWALAASKPQEAVEWYRKAALLNLTDATLMYRLGVAYTRIPEKKEQGEQLKAFVPWLVLGDSRMAEELVKVMEGFGEKGEVERLDAYLDRFGKAGSTESMRPHLTRQRDAAEKGGDYARALVWAEQTLLVPASGFSSRDELILLAMEDVAAYQRIRSLDAWTRKDFGVVADALGRELENGPPDVEVMEKVVPALKGAAREAAEKVVNRARERLRAVVDAYPEVEVYKDQLRRVDALR